MDVSKLDISNFLPHIHPMLMIDRMLEINDDYVISELLITKNNIFLIENHLSESGLIENAAQTCSLIVGKTVHMATNQKAIGYINSIKSLQIFKTPKINSTIITKAKVVQNYSLNEITNSTIQCKTYSNNELYLEGIISLIITKNSNKLKT